MANFNVIFSLKFHIPVIACCTMSENSCFIYLDQSYSCLCRRVGVILSNLSWPKGEPLNFIA